MNHHLLVPLGVVALTGFLVPWLVVRARWAQQAPRLALAVWAACGALFAAATALVPAQLVLPIESSHRLADMMYALRPPTVGQLLHLDGRERFAFALSLAVLSLPAAAFVHRLARARRVRVRHAGVLRLVDGTTRHCGPPSSTTTGPPCTACPAGRARSSSPPARWTR